MKPFYIRLVLSRSGCLVSEQHDVDLLGHPHHVCRHQDVCPPVPHHRLLRSPHQDQLPRHLVQGEMSRDWPAGCQPLAACHHSGLRLECVGSMSLHTKLLSGDHLLLPAGQHLPWCQLRPGASDLCSIIPAETAWSPLQHCHPSHGHYALPQIPLCQERFSKCAFPRKLTTLNLTPDPISIICNWKMMNNPK